MIRSFIDWDQMSVIFMGSGSSFATKQIQSIRFLKHNFSAILTRFVGFGIRTRESTAAVRKEQMQCNNDNTVIQLCMFLWMPSVAISCDCKVYQQ